MKYSILLLALLASTAQAGWNPLTGSNSSATAVGVGVGLGGNGQGGNGGNAVSGGNSVEFNDRLQIPNAPALSSGSSNSNGINRIYRQRQVSFILGGYTNVDMVLDLPAFVGANPPLEVQIAACVQDAGYREFRRIMKDPCPK